MRPIDADALISEIRSSFEGMEGTLASSGALFVIVALKNAPTLTLDDLRPKGRWIPLHSEGYNPEYDPLFEWECFECHNNFANDEDEIPYNFCPNCGADMRGGEEDG